MSEELLLLTYFITVYSRLFYKNALDEKLSIAII